MWLATQVMADAADLCVHSLLHHCPSPKLLKPLADVICTDKNAKLRQHCAKYMLQVGLPASMQPARSCFHAAHIRHLPSAIMPCVVALPLRVTPSACCMGYYSHNVCAKPATKAVFDAVLSVSECWSAL